MAEAETNDVKVKEKKTKPEPKKSMKDFQKELEKAVDDKIQIYCREHQLNVLATLNLQLEVLYKLKLLNETGGSK